MKLDEERERQRKFLWQRSKFYAYYNKILGYYQVVSCLENAKGVSLLDLACGDGTLTQMFAEYFQIVVGVDASPTHIEEARRRVPSARFFVSLIEEFSLEEKFDTVVLINVLEHVEDPVMVLTKAASFLSEDSVLIVHVPNALAINRRIAVLMGTLKSCYELSPFDIEVAGHRRSYDLEMLIKDVEKSGLKVVKTGGIFYKMLSSPQMDWFLKNGLWEEGGFGWGRVGEEKTKDWRAEFCRACYEIGKERPEDCNIIYVCASSK